MDIRAVAGCRYRFPAHVWDQSKSRFPAGKRLRRCRSYGFADVVSGGLN